MAFDLPPLPSLPSRIFHHADWHGADGNSWIATDVRMPLRLINADRFGSYPGRFHSYGFDTAQFALLSTLVDRIPEDGTTPVAEYDEFDRTSRLARDTWDVQQAVSHPGERLQGGTGSHPPLRLRKLKHFPHAMYFKDDIYCRGF